MMGTLGLAWQSISAVLVVHFTGFPFSCQPSSSSDCGKHKLELLVSGIGLVLLAPQSRDDTCHCCLQVHR